ncbi:MULTISPECIES: type IV pilus modification protein PilV [Dyella]|nr:MULTISPECIES: type IV pilus modification protein PilV [Dyella]
MRMQSLQRGVSLIEVMVAVIVFSVGVLGIAMLQAKGSQFTKQSGARTVAILQARSLADAMRANPAGVWGVASQDLISGKNGDLSGSYYLYDGTTAPDPTTCNGVASCVAAKSDLLNWLAQLNAGAINAGSNSSVAQDSNTGTLTVKSSWSDLTPGSTSTSTESYQFDFQP